MTSELKFWVLRGKGSLCGILLDQALPFRCLCLWADQGPGSPSSLHLGYQIQILRELLEST